MMLVAFTTPAQFSAQTTRPAYFEYCEGVDLCPISTVVSFAQAQLENVLAECRYVDWDGHGAAAVSPDAYQAAKRFIGTLPPGIPQPALSADPDGCVTFEWRSLPRKLALVSVHPDFQLDFAAIFGTSRVYGSEPFFDQLPDGIENLVRRIYA